MQSGIVTKSRSKLRNVAKGIVPTFDTFGVNPSDAANATDDNFATATGAGTKITSGGGTFGQAIFDLGSLKNVLIGGRVSSWSAAGGVAMRAYVDTSADNITYNSATTYEGLTTAVDSPYGLLTTLRYCRYIRLRFYAGGAGDCNAKIYELKAYEV